MTSPPLLTRPPPPPTSLTSLTKALAQIVPASVARVHLAQLAALGIGTRQVATLTGSAASVVWAVRNGHQTTLRATTHAHLLTARPIVALRSWPRRAPGAPWIASSARATPTGRSAGTWRTVEQAAELRDLELQRFDQMVAGLWPQVEKGSPPAVSAAIRVSERRSRLLGLDEPTATRTEISGSLSVDAERRLNAEAEDLQRWLTSEELRELAEKSERLFADARALVQARRTPMLLGVSPSPAADIDDVMAGEPAEQSTAPTLSDQQDAAGAKPAPSDTP